MSRKYATKVDIETITSQIEQYKKEYGFYPERLKDLVPKYLKKVPLDVWGKDYMLEVSKNEYRLYTLGQDGMSGGDGLSYDFSNNTDWEEHLNSKHN